MVRRCPVIEGLKICHDRIFAFWTQKLRIIRVVSTAEFQFAIAVCDAQLLGDRHGRPPEVRARCHGRAVVSRVRGRYLFSPNEPAVAQDKG
jgi:hypothetical protein